MEFFIFLVDFQTKVRSLFKFGLGIKYELLDTAFNDLWRFDTHRCTWERIICTRTPRPKGNALMLAFQSENMLILTGGRPPQMHTNVPMQLPGELNTNELDILNMSPIISYKSNQSKILCRDWRPLQPLNRPLGRFNAAGCVLGMETSLK